MDFVFIDSGMGGIPYMMRLKSLSPSHTCIYLADSAAFPYGDKSQEEVSSRALYVASLAVKLWKPAAIVIACNTMSVAALPALRSAFPALPIVGTVPAIRLAAQSTTNGRIGFLATDATVAASYSQELTRTFASDCQIFPLGCHELVSFVEKRIAYASDREKEDAVRECAQYFADHDCDTIILGCTHFTHLSDTFERIFRVLRPNTRVVDSRDGVARQALRVCRLHGTDPEHDKEVFVTGEDAASWQTLCNVYNLVWKGHVS